MIIDGNIQVGMYRETIYLDEDFCILMWKLTVVQKCDSINKDFSNYKHVQVGCPNYYEYNLKAKYPTDVGTQTPNRCWNPNI